MSLYTVARDDFRNVAKSYAVVGVVGVFTLLVALIFYSEMNTFAHPYRTLWDVQQFVGIVLPIVLAPLTYLAIAGDLVSGRITFAMGLPNRREEYFGGKVLSRFAVAAIAVLVGLAVGLAIAAATFANAPSVVRFLTFTFGSMLFALAWVSLFVAISASTGKRSRAMLGAIGAYFLLVPFWFGMIGPVSLDAVLGAVTDLLGVSLSESARHYVNSLSPTWAFMGVMEPVYAGVTDEYEILATQYGGDTAEMWAQTWYNVLVLLGWSTVSLGVGYLNFQRSELG